MACKDTSGTRPVHVRVADLSGVDRNLRRVTASARSFKYKGRASYRSFRMKLHFRSLLGLALVAILVGCSSRQARENELKHDLAEIRKAIDDYTIDKQQYPKSLQDLVDSHYLREIPIDPIAGTKDWTPEFTDAVPNVNQTTVGISDVHSGSVKVGSDGRPYDNW